MSEAPEPVVVVRRPPIDPRFRRRRAEALRQEGRRRLRALVTVAALVAVAALAAVAVRSPLLKVRHVDVTGNGHTPTAQVVGAAGLAGPRRVAMVDAGAASAIAAVDRLPWVRSARFSRHWPWTVSIAVTERVPAALVRTSAGGAPPPGVDVVDGTGRVLEELSRRENLPSLPVVSGLLSASPGQHVMPAPGTSPVQEHELLEAAASMPASLRRQDAVVSRSGHYGLTAVVGPTKALVVLGNASQMGEKWAVLDELQAKVGLRAYVQVDISVPDRPALTPSSSVSGS